MKKLCVYELNEVPKRVIDTYAKLKPKSTIAHLVAKHNYIETETSDDCELHPWTSWPTVHRGVSSNEHNIRFINQELEEVNNIYEPIWDYLIKQGKTIGIFGSLQSYPPRKGKYVDFYVPDTFSPHYDTYPQKLQDLQAINLKLAGKNKGISSKISTNDVLILIKYFCIYRPTLSQIKHISRHIVGELTDSKWSKRRSILQPILTFDTYMKLLYQKKPDYSTYFTNHVAGMMHRYWKFLYPSQSGKTIYKDDSDLFKKNSIIYAMDIADEQIRKLYLFCKENNTELWIQSALGQEGIERGVYMRELFVEDYQILLSNLGLNPSDYIYLPSMQPDISFKCKEIENLKEIQKKIICLRTKQKKPIFRLRYLPVERTVNFKLEAPHEIFDEEDALEYFSSYHSLSSFGLKLVDRDPGTGYHQKDGIFLSYGEKTRELLEKRERINTKELNLLTKRFFNLVDND